MDVTHGRDTSYFLKNLLTPSLKTFIELTTTNSITPGKNTNHQALKFERTSDSILPQVTWSTDKPSPKKDKVASKTTAELTPKANTINAGLITFGKMCWVTIFKFGKPKTLALSM